MAKFAPLQGNFSAGEISPLLAGRVESERYKAGLDSCVNMIPTLQGGATRRGGTKYAANVKTSANKTRLIPFQFSTTQNYIIEFGNLYCRFYTNRGQILSGGVPYEIASVFTTAELPLIKYTQSADVLYLVHPNHAPVKLQRFGNTNWAFQTLSFKDGPYLTTGIAPAVSSAATTITSITSSSATGVTNLAIGGWAISAAANNGSGLIRVTVPFASAFNTGDQVFISGVGGTTEANGTWIVTAISQTTYDLQGSAFVHAYTSGGNFAPAIWTANDVGRSMRLFYAGWAWGIITSFTDGAHVALTWKGGTGSTAATGLFRFGLYGTSAGYPTCVTFHEDRLIFGGAASAPQRVDGSVTGDYENFAPSAYDGTVAGSNAFGLALNSNEVNAIKWMTSDEKGLPIGTVGGEWILRPSSLGEALTALNATAKKVTNYGSADIQPILAGKSSIYVQRNTRKVRELCYFYEVDGFRSTDISLLAEHVTSFGVTAEVVFQRTPQPVVWMGRTDGTLIGMTFDRDLQTLKAGWHRHILGGVSDAAGTQPVVESIATIPSPDATTDDLWIVVKRWINGTTVRTVEYMTKIFESFDLQEDGYFVDCGSTYDAPLTVTGITKANPAVVTSIAHGLSNGDKVVIRKVFGMSQVNYKKYTIAGVTANTFQLNDDIGNAIDSSAFSTYVSGGEVRKLVTTISGLTWLEGESVYVVADGAPQNNKTVSGGSITLDYPSGTVHVGYNANADIKTLRLDPAAQTGTSLGKLRKTAQISLLLDRTLGLQIGTSFSRLDKITFQTSVDQYGLVSALFSGIKRNIQLACETDTENQYCIRQPQPLPFTLLAIMPKLNVEDEL